MNLSNKIAINNSWAALICLSILLLLGCKKLVEVPAPVSSISDGDVYTNDGTATSVLTGIYIQMSNGNTFPGGGTFVPNSLLMGLAADELTLYSSSLNNGLTLYYTNALYPSDQENGAVDYWGSTYSVIYICNAAIEGLTNSSGLTAGVKQQLLGEAKFMRAFCYFYLVNLYGDVPLATTTDYSANRMLPRASRDKVYQQIISDLKDAKNLLSINYLDGSLLKISSERVRPTKWAAAALLARTFLYTGDWQSAKTEADSIIDNSLFKLTSLENVFLKNSDEAIWQLQPVNIGQNTGDALVYIIPSTGPNSTQAAYLSDSLLTSFEPGDQRRINWIDSVTVSGKTFYFPYKYKSNIQDAPVTEYKMEFRLGEQYLIRAEAEAQLGDIFAAQADLNAIRKRAGLSNTTADDKPSILKSILQERKIELFTEGQRWFDLKRTGSIDSVMNITCPNKGGTWSSFKQLFPIPSHDIQFDPNLIQNEGY